MRNIKARAKTALLKNRASRALIRHAILTSRKLYVRTFAHLYKNPAQLIDKLSKTEHGRNALLSTRNVGIAWADRLAADQTLIRKVEQIAVKKKRRPLLRKVASFYFRARVYSKAYELLCLLIENEQNEAALHAHIVRAIQAERHLKKHALNDFIKANEVAIPEKSRHLIDCEYCQHYDEYIPDWNRIIELLREDFDNVLTNFCLLAAFGNKELTVIDRLGEIIIERAKSDPTIKNQKTVTMLAAVFYRSGEKEKLIKLEKEFKYTDLGWKIYMAFGRDEILEAMNLRGESIQKTFSTFYPYSVKGRKLALTPEKDLCGEAFNALFYDSIYDSEGSVTVICDSRLSKCLSRSFPQVEFIPKTPRYRQFDEPEHFDRLPPKARDYLDNESLKAARKLGFKPIDYAKHYDSPETQRGLQTGWLKPDPELVEYWKQHFGSHKKLIGISANSTLRSKVRDLHMIGLEHWAPIFSLDNCLFINLNAGLSIEETEKYEKQYGIKFITPEIDLFNDFENLLAIMSILDFALVPANNLMDFSSALGTKTIIFSPSNIMKTWVKDSENHYIFSENTTFIFREPGVENPIEQMVEKAANIIKAS